MAGKTPISINDLKAHLHNDLSKIYLYNKSEKNLERFLNLFKESNCVSFIGAGAPIPLNIPTWAKLIEEIYLVAKNENFLEPPETDEAKFPQFAEDIYN